MFNHCHNGNSMIYGPSGINPQWKRKYGANGIYTILYSPSGNGMVL